MCMYMMGQRWCYAVALVVAVVVAGTSASGEYNDISSPVFAPVVMLLCLRR